jgi:hypothetical protein
MKRFEVRFVEVYHIEAENEDDAYNLALLAQDEKASEHLTDEQLDRIDYRHGDDTTREI